MRRVASWRGSHLQRSREDGGRVQSVDDDAAIDAAVQQERQRLARELHDSVAQNLFAVTLGASRALTLLERNESEDLYSIIGELLRLASAGQAELRALLRGLRADESHQLEGGLTGTLTNEVVQLRARAGLQVRLSVAGEPDLPPSVKVTVARITREALRNIAKHAQATCVHMVLELCATSMTLVVADDGRGFDPRTAHPGHFGLQLMREQALAVGGAMELSSAPGRGTQVRLRVPRPPR
jgi:signal transduction histidine kinase